MSTQITFNVTHLYFYEIDQNSYVYAYFYILSINTNGIWDHTISFGNNYRVECSFGISS